MTNGQCESAIIGGKGTKGRWGLGKDGDSGTGNSMGRGPEVGKRMLGCWDVRAGTLFGLLLTSRPSPPARGLWRLEEPLHGGAERNL